MKLLNKNRLIFVCYILFIAMFFYTPTISAKKVRKSKRSSSKHKSKRSRSSAPQRQKQIIEKTEEKSTAKEEINKTEKPVTVNQEQTESKTNPQTENTKEEQKSNTKEEIKESTEEQGKKEVPDMSKDAKWEEFQLCMQNGCSGSDDQPNHVQCYKSLNFENQFNSCKALIDKEKSIKFKTYFTEIFIPKEKKEFCENTENGAGGTWDEKNKKCAIKVTFKRNKHKNECLDSCSAVSVSKTWYLDGRTYTCSPDIFNVEPCYKDSANCAAVKTTKTMGTVKLISGIMTGAIAGATSAISATRKIKTGKKDEKGNEIIEETSSRHSKEELDSLKAKANKEINLNTQKTEAQDALKQAQDDNKALLKKQITNGLIDGFAAGTSQIMEGTGELIKADILKKEKGDMLQGRCVLPDGKSISEGGSINLSW